MLDGLTIAGKLEVLCRFLPSQARLTIAEDVLAWGERVRVAAEADAARRRSGADPEAEHPFDDENTYTVKGHSWPL